jgi:hypothetical protein
MGTAQRSAFSAIEALAHERGLFRPRQLRALRGDPSWLGRLVQSGSILRHPPGVYSEAHRIYARALCAAAKWPTTVICGPSALHLRGLCPEPEEVWLAIGRKARAPTTHELRLQIIRRSDLCGDVERKMMGGVVASVFSVSRALFDSLRHLERMPTSLVRESVVTAVKYRLITRGDLQSHACRRTTKDALDAFDVFAAGVEPLPLQEGFRPVLPPRFRVERRPHDALPAGYAHTFASLTTRLIPSDVEVTVVGTSA